MNVLFAHNNFPAQFRNLAADMASDPRHVVRAIGATTAPGLANVRIDRYAAPAGQYGPVHPFARHFEMECRRAERVLYAASALAASGFEPELVFVHCGWGENLPFRAVFPKARIATYCEFYFRAEGQDVHFDPEAPRLGADGVVTLQSRNASTLMALAESDLGVAPTNWQRSTFPKEFIGKIKVVHDGVDIGRARPNPLAQIATPSGRILRRGDEIVTFVARSLEPTRGFHVFMRAAPAILARRPKAEIVIVGAEQTSYGPPPPQGASWKERLLDETRDELDLARVHFMGSVGYEAYLSVLQASRVHVYLTYPFVLSWSLIEAMSVGCTIVASDTAPVREAIDDETGILTPFFDASTLADRIVAVLQDPRAYGGRAARARESAAVRFDKRRCIPQLKRALGISH